MSEATDKRSAPVLGLTSPHSPSSAEQHATRLAGFEVESEVDLQIPTSLKGDDLGGLGAFAQLVITWARRQRSGTLRTYVPGSVDHTARDHDDRRRAIENFVQSDHGLLGLLMSGRVVDRQGASLLGEVSRPLTGQLANAGRTSTAKRGRKITLVAADHRSENAPFSLYQPASDEVTNHAIRTRDEFESLASELLTVIGLGTSAERPSHAQEQALGIILYQLFKNTHDWARTDAHDHKYARSVRIIRSEYVADPLQTHLQHAYGDGTLSAFLSHDSHKGEARPDAKLDMRRFLEVSILDSGPGLAARSLRALGIENPTLAEEHGATLACLKKHMTSSSQRGRGNGLHVVQELMTELRGYMKVRSGRLALVRDYVQDPYTQRDAKEPWMNDWATGTRLPTEMAPVVGTLVSFVIPIRWFQTSPSERAEGDRSVS